MKTALGAIRFVFATAFVVALGFGAGSLAFPEGAEAYQCNYQICVYHTWDGYRCNYIPANVKCLWFDYGWDDWRCVTVECGGGGGEDPPEEPEPEGHGI